MKLSTQREREQIEKIAKFYKYEQNRTIARNAAQEMADYKNRQMKERMGIVFKCLKEKTILSAATLQNLKREITLAINDHEESSK